MSMDQPSLFDTLEERPGPPDQAAREFAVDPANDVVLEASAGTGKTRVLVERYLRLLGSGVDPRFVLAITFTRKAAAEMRDRVLAELVRRAADPARNDGPWRALRERVADVQISTVDAFCFGLLREFPLEGGVDPGFEIADETEMARFANEAMDMSFRIAHGLIASDEPLRLLFARVAAPVLRDAVKELLDRRHLAVPAVGKHVRRLAGPETADGVAAAFLSRLRDLISGSPHQPGLLQDGPEPPEFAWLCRDLAPAGTSAEGDAAGVGRLRRRLDDYFLTSKKPRQKLAQRLRRELFASLDARKRHEDAVRTLAPAIAGFLERLDADVDGLLARGFQRLLAIAADRYERLLVEHGLLDFAGMLHHAVELLERQEEFAQSRLKLQARYRPLLVDEFQDTSRLQWRLIELLIDSWGEGEGAADESTSIFVVGDRKQSIYRFRHAEVTLLDEAARKISALRPGRQPRRAMTTSFRAVPELLAFFNAFGHALQRETTVDERFTYDERDRFPVPEGGASGGEPVVGVVAEATMAACASAVAAEAKRLVGSVVVRPADGPPRPARPDDIAVLFRARAGHQFFEQALEAQGLLTYVYKGLGFFDAPEVQDLHALLRYLAEPDSDLRAAEFLRSSFVRVSDVGLARLAPGFAAALTGATPEPAAPLDAPDQALLALAREGVARWLPLADHLTPGELVDAIIGESAYLYELRGARLAQARENLKKVRGLLRRVENRGYATIGRLAEYFETLRAGDESNAIIDASGCVQLMTIHAAKGLEFPIVFVVNIQGQGRGRPSVSVIERGPEGEPEVAFRANAATRLEDAREEEELRRLWYVAVTRARDRLYLAGQLGPKGELKKSQRSLAGLLPRSLSDLFARVPLEPDADRLEWPTPEGAFAFRVCRAESAAAPAAEPDAPASVAGIDVRELVVPGRRIASVTSLESVGARRSPRAAGPERDGHDALVGTLVHRLLARRLLAETDATRVRTLVRDELRPDEGIDVADEEALVGRAAALYSSLRTRPDVVALLGSGEWHTEVPFSYVPPERPQTLIRGVIDAVVVAPDGLPTVVEFKTGTPRPEHDAQAAVYARALAAAWGSGPVEVRILYA